jgi:hypothetical protein
MKADKILPPLCSPPTIFIGIEAVVDLVVYHTAEDEQRAVWCPDMYHDMHAQLGVSGTYSIASAWPKRLKSGPGNVARRRLIKMFMMLPTSPDPRPPPTVPVYT